MRHGGRQALLLSIDVSNRRLSLALWPLPAGPRPPDEPLAHWLLGLRANATADELRLSLAQLLADAGLDRTAVVSCIVASVVPDLRASLHAACLGLFGSEPRFVGPGLRTGMAIRTENPAELGPDRLANALAACRIHRAPVVVLDFGTALTVDLVDAGGAYLGTLIAPGLEVAADALARRTARLGRIGLEAPERAIGADTESGLRSGLVFGYAGLIDGLLEAAQAQLGGEATVLATGDLDLAAPLLAQLHPAPQRVPWLTHQGLAILWHLNPGPA